MAQLILNDDDLKIIKTLLKLWVPDALVMAYGSRIKGRCHAGSDLDIVIQNTTHPEEPNHQIDALNQACIESNMTILVDLSDWALLPESFRQEIKKNHVLIQAKNP